MNNANPILEAARALNADPKELSGFSELQAGKTNRSCLFFHGGQSYILRIPGAGTANLVDRRQEAAVYRAISGKEFCDDVVYLNPETGLKITRYLEGARCCDPYSSKDTALCMQLLRRLHEQDLRVAHRFDLFDRIESYEALRNGSRSSYGDYHETKAKVLSLRDFVESAPKKNCLAHIDSVPSNFLFFPSGGKERLQLTDWEYAGMQDPHVDVAMFCLSSMYDRAHTDRLIDIYFNGACDRITRIKIYCYLAICGLLWSNWCEYKKLLGVAFGAYADFQYHFSKEYSAIAAEEIQALTNDKTVKGQVLS